MATRHASGHGEDRGSTSGARWSAWPLGVLAWAEDLVHYIVALVLVALAAGVLVQTVSDFFRTGSHPFATRVTSVVNGVLFVIIVMEILSTVVAHFKNAGFQLKPFLIIGIISAVRHVLTIGAQLSLQAETSNSAFRRTQIELGVNAAVVLALVLGLVLVRRTDTADD